MLTRREFLSATGAMAFAGGSLARGARDDLLVRRGRVRDPSAGVDRIADVAITGRRIRAIQPDIPPAAAADVLDARGRIVTPGLIDRHVHVDNHQRNSGDSPG